MTAEPDNSPSAEAARILLVGGDSRRSGVPRHICHLARVLSAMADVHVASEPDQGGYRDLARCGAEHRATRGLKSGLLPHRLFKGGCNLMKLVKSEDWHIVWLHARLPGLLGRAALALRLWRPTPGTRVVQTYHGLPFGPGHRRGFSTLSRWIERWMLSTCPPLDLVFLSPYQADQMTAAMGARRMSRHHVHILQNGSDLGKLPSRVERDDGQRHLIMTGRSGYQKNLALAVRLFSHLPDDCHLILCGDGTDHPRLQRRLRKMAGAAEGRLHFKGQIRNVAPLLMQADAYMLTSRYEGIPIGALEAFEAGLPMVLNRFETSGDLAETHPPALQLPMKSGNLAADAAKVDAMLTEFMSDPTPHRAEFQAAWKNHWSGQVFERQARALVTTWLTRPADSSGDSRADTPHGKVRDKGCPGSAPVLKRSERPPSDLPRLVRL
jgi:glycosyltransferase involved in cell wall biosynthesis